MSNAEKIAAFPVGTPFHFVNDNGPENITWTTAEDGNAYAHHAEEAFDLPLNSNPLFPGDDDAPSVETYGEIVEGASPIELTREDVSDLDRLLAALGMML